MRNSTLTREITIFKKLLISEIVHVMLILSFREEPAEEIQKKKRKKSFYLEQLNSQTNTELHIMALKTMVSKASA